MLSTWLHRIVVNAALMKLRTRERRPETSIEALLPAFLPDGQHAAHLDDWSMPPPDRLLREEVRSKVRTAIDQLPDRHRTVLILRDIEELSTQAVATQLGMTRTAVKMRLHRARQALRTLLDPLFAARGPSRKPPSALASANR